MTATYDDQWFRVRCTECEGLFGDDVPRGTLYLSYSPAAGVRDRSPAEVLSTGLYRCHLDITYMMHGVCRECAGRISGAVSVCDDHDSREGSHCDSCGTPFAVWAELRCGTCRFAKRLPVELFTVGLTPVVSFLHDQGIDVLAPTFDRIVDIHRTRFETTVDEEPLRVSVFIEGQTEMLTVSFDADMCVEGVDRRPKRG